MYASQVRTCAELQGHIFWKIVTNVWRVLQDTDAHSRDYVTSKKMTQNIHSYMYTHKHADTHIHIHIYIHLRIHMHMHIHIHIIHTHIQLPIHTYT